MTIAAGFKCVDGVVLAVDSQYSGGIGKSKGAKLFPLWQKPDCYSVTLAIAGSVAMAKRAIETFRDLVDKKIGNRPAALEELRELLEDALCAIHNKHVYPAPPSERTVLDFWLLMATWTPSDGLGLFRTDLTAATPVEHHTCIGIGDYLGNYVADFLVFHDSPFAQLEDTKPVAAYLISAAKDFVDGCGLTTFMSVITKRGISQSITPGEISDGQEFYESVLRSLRIHIGDAANVNLPGGSGPLDGLHESLRILAAGFRKKQLERLARQEAQADLQSTTADPSRSQPSQG